MQHNANRSISTTIPKTQIQIDQRPQYETNHIEFHTREVGSTLELFDTRDDSLNITPVTHTLRTKINKWDLLKLKRFCKAKELVLKTKWKSTD